MLSTLKQGRQLPVCELFSASTHFNTVVLVTDFVYKLVFLWCGIQATERDWPDLYGHQRHGDNARRLQNCQDSWRDGTLHCQGLQAWRYWCLHRRIWGTERLASQPETWQDHIPLNTWLVTETAQHLFAGLKELVCGLTFATWSRKVLM